MVLLALIIAGLVGAAAQAAPPDAPLRLIQANDEIVTWLDDASIQRRGDRIRARTLRVRRGTQGFWLVSEVDCDAQTQGLASVTNLGDPEPSPFLDGTARQSPIQPHDRYGRALKAALCDRARPYVWAGPVADAATAVAASAEASRRGEAERPLALVRAGGLYVDRETLGGGGPQWDFKTLQVSRDDHRAGRAWGRWTRWEIDCGRRTADRLDVAEIRGNGDVGPVLRDDDPAEAVTATHQMAAALALVCDADPWRLPAADSLDAALDAAS